MQLSIICQPPASLSALALSLDIYIYISVQNVLVYTENTVVCFSSVFICICVCHPT